MREIRPPTKVPGFGSISKSVFLAGGITNCPDWQAELVKKLDDTNLVLFNPRRESFDVSDPTLGKAQIKWEFDHLARSKAVSFWFCKDTLCPITLFELGAHAVWHDAIVVGIEPGYQREFDIRWLSCLKRLDLFTGLCDLGRRS